MANAVVGNDGRILVTINRESFVVDPGAFVIVNGGELMKIEDAIAADLTVERTELTDAEKSRSANQATSSGANLDTSSDHDSGIPSGPSPQPAPDPEPAPTSSGGGSTSGGSGGGASGASEPADTEPQSDFREVPPNAEVWHIDGRIYLAWDVIDPATGERVGVVGFHVTDGDRWNEIRGELGQVFDFDGTLEDAEMAGFIDGGIEQELADFGDSDPLETFYEDYEEQFSLSPLYGDPEILALLVKATLEGRDITDAELADTDYWTTRTESQRAWEELALKDPATASQRRTANRDNVRSQLMASGYLDAPDSLVDYLADNFTTGQWTPEQLQMQLSAEIDPYSANASPFAGIYDWSALGDYSVVTDGTDFWVRTGQGDYLLDGPGQVARFSAQAEGVTLAQAGQHVIIGNTHYFIDENGDYYEATGGGQIDGLERLYGPARRMAISRGGPPTVAGTVVDLFGGAGGIEKVGEINQVGTAGDLAEAAGGANLATTQLGREEEVREMLRQYLGPYHAANYTDQWVAEWAGRLRNGAAGEVDLLRQELQRSFQGLYKGYDENDYYESIAAPVRGMWQQASGNTVNENRVDFQEFLQLGPDAANREGWLRGRGLQERWAPVTQQALASLTDAFGPQVRPDMAQGVY